MFSGGNAGGFFNSDNNDNKADDRRSSMKNDTSPNKGKKGSNLVPMTIKAILQASSGVDDVIKIDGFVAENCLIVGRIYNIQPENNAGKTELDIDDTTGKLRVQILKKEAGPKLNSLNLKPQMYVRVMVRMNAFKGKQNFMCIKVQPVEDFNQITYHLLQCFVARAQRTKGYLPNQEKENIPGSQNEYSAAPTFNNYGAPQNNNYGAPQNNSTTNKTMSKDPQENILFIMKDIQAKTHGGFVHTEALVQRFRGQMEERVLKNYLKKLLNDGKIMNFENDDMFTVICD